VSAARMIISSSGNVGIGTSNPTGLLHLASPGEPILRIDSGLQSGSQLQLSSRAGLSKIGTVNNSELAFFINCGNVVMLLDQNGNLNVGGPYTATEKLTVDGNICATGTIGVCSDRRFKHNVEPVHDALVLVAKLNPVRFDWRCSEFPDHHFSKERQLGFIAQEIAPVVPEIVSKGKDGYYSVDYGRLTPVLVQAIKEQQKIIADQQKQIADLSAMQAEKDGRMDELAARLARIEAAMNSQAVATGR